MGFSIGIDPLGIAQAGLGFLGSFDAQRRMRNAARERDALIAQISSQLDRQVEDLRSSHARDLVDAAGTGGDAIQALGRRLGDSLAAAGVYNSSATAGALTQAQADQQSSLARLARQLKDDELARVSENQRYLTGLRLGQADQNTYEASTPNPVYSGLSSILDTVHLYPVQKATSGGSGNRTGRSAQRAGQNQTSNSTSSGTRPGGGAFHRVGMLGDSAEAATFHPGMNGYLNYGKSLPVEAFSDKVRRLLPLTGPVWKGRSR